jgi:hypothetical protein
MGQFKPMTKMMTTEPSVILKLKKGGHVNMKDEACEQDGHSPMRKGLTVAIAVGKPRGGGAEGASPGKPSMSERRKAMAAPFMKKGGKTMKKAYGGSVDDSDTEAGASPVMAEDMMRGIVGLPGYDTKYTMADVQNAQKAGNSYKAQTDNKARGVVGLPGGDSSATMQDVINSSRAGSGMAAMPTVPTPRVRPPMRGGRADIPMSAMKKGGSTDMAQDKAMIRKAMGQHDAQEHKGGKGTKLALKGGGNANSFVNTKMSDGDKNDRARGTGGVRTGAAGYKDGGTISGNAGKFLNNVSGGDRYDSAKGTGGVKMANSGGFKSGGSIDWANRPADTMKPGMTGTSTGGVRNSNAGGYKMGGAAKKAYATGGSVDTGRPVAYASKPVSKPVSNTAQSGTFSTGGRVPRTHGGHDEFVSKQIADIVRRPKNKKLGELREGFGPSDHQALDAPRMSPPSSFADSIDMRKAMVIPGRGGDYYNKAKGGKVIKKADGGMIGPDNLPQGMPGAGVPAGMPTGMPPMGMPTMANQPSLAAQQAMQKVLGTPDTGGLSGYKRGGSAKRVHRHTSAALRAMQ